MQALAQLVERLTVVENKHQTAAGSIPASLNRISLEKFAAHFLYTEGFGFFWSNSVVWLSHRVLTPITRVRISVGPSQGQGTYGSPNPSL